MNIWIFECNELTQLECWERNLFGSNSKWPLNVKNGEYCLLYNYSQGSEHLVYGVYKTTSNGSRSIVQEAWGGEFPYQVRVGLVSKEKIAIPRFNLRKIIVNQETKRVMNKIYGDKAQDLLQYYAFIVSGREKTKEELQIIEDYRLKFPRDCKCIDGHEVRSLSEQTIDNWLSSNKIYHEYERLLNIPERMVPDFTVYRPDGSAVYIEFWGLDSPEYQERRLKKSEIYFKHGFSVIELYPDDVKNIDFNLREKLRKSNVKI